MTTLADLTPEQRYDCVGMWATVSSEHYPAVIVRIYGGNPDYAQMLAPEINDYYTSNLTSVTPRFDLPRAWNPDGYPTEGEWLTAEHLSEDQAGHGPRIDFFTTEPTHRQWVGEWEKL